MSSTIAPGRIVALAAILCASAQAQPGVPGLSAARTWAQPASQGSAKPSAVCNMHGGWA
jgi:hypothetical protein